MSHVSAVWISATELEFVQVVIEISTRRRLNLPKKNREMLNHLFPHHIHTDLEKREKVLCGNSNLLTQCWIF